MRTQSQKEPSRIFLLLAGMLFLTAVSFGCNLPSAQSPRGIPWFVFPGEDSLWAVHADGSGLTQIGDQVVQWNRDWVSGAAPSGGHVAFISGQDDFHNLALNIYSFETGESRLITRLVSPDLEPDPDDVFEREEAIEAITFAESLAWSPDGSRLAFVGAMDGPSSDLYVYALAGDSITRLTDSPGQVHHMRWSPDGEYILYYGVETFGTGAGYALTGTFAARADSSGINTLSGPFSGDGVVIGWLDNRTAVVYSWGPSCGSNDLRSLNIETGAESMLFAGALEDAAMDPASGSMVVLVSEYAASCNSGADQGVYFIARGSSPSRILGDDPNNVQWSRAAEMFFVHTETGAVAFSTDGEWVQLETLTNNHPAANPLDKTLAWYGGSGLWLSPFQVDLDGPMPERVFEQPVLFAAWDPSGEYLLFMGEDYISKLHHPTMEILQVAVVIGGRVGIWVYP